MKSALITGINGQDGAYLAAHLLKQGYRVIGAARRSAAHGDSRLVELGIEKDVEIKTIELTESSNITHLIKQLQPDEIYNLGAQSFVAESFASPEYTANVDALAVLRILEAIRAHCPETRFYQASTSEMFGKVQAIPQSETTPFYPRSPYGVAKLFGHWSTVNHRESYGMHATSGILFNHESPLRGPEFVTRKITKTLASIRQGDATVLKLGNMDAKRDWGFAGDYVVGMWLMVQAQEADDFVLATGQTHTVREFVAAAASVCEFDLEWTGTGPAEKAIDRKTGKTIVAVNPEFYRPAEVDLLIGDPSKAKAKLGWQATVTFQQLSEMMMMADLKRAAKK